MFCKGFVNDCVCVGKSNSFAKVLSMIVSVWGIQFFCKGFVNDCVCVGYPILLHRFC